ncbi:hypothetical protein AVEN_187620-1 [Araneus ventricosus]|uniref:Uncharacterized protein n=1 Tax=Araneus ventricosus TaxID=182803 RepID=A0A4Y2K096_ARAVE|nr:hypothetical protein AVEN_187620-1 [Araneus ventricosus]
MVSYNATVTGYVVPHVSLPCRHTMTIALTNFDKNILVHVQCPLPITLMPLYTPELGTQWVPCQLNGYAWKEVHIVLLQGDMIDPTYVLVSVKSS